MEGRYESKASSVASACLGRVRGVYKDVRSTNLAPAREGVGEACVWVLTCSGVGSANLAPAGGRTASKSHNGTSPSHHLISSSLHSMPPHAPHAPSPTSHHAPHVSAHPHIPHAPHASHASHAPHAPHGLTCTSPSRLVPPCVQPPLIMRYLLTTTATWSSLGSG